MEPARLAGEVVSPLVLLVVIGLETKFYDLPGIERAPFLANSGILGGWALDGFQGETPMLLSIVLVVRISFCWVELKIRHHLYRDHPHPHNGPTGVAADGSNQPRLLNGATRSRRSSMSVLYSRIAESLKTPSHMRHLAVGLFCWQPVVLVFAAATMGKAGAL